MRVLVACEFSGVVRDAFRRRGHDAWSCDLLEAEGDPEHHYLGDVRGLLGEENYWDLMIAHPPCTYLAISAGRVDFEKRRAALAFVRELMAAPYGRICIENPVGAINTFIRRPEQTIQPWEYGHGETKATCLWLTNLPRLTATNIVEGREPRILNMSNTARRARERSRTYLGVAEAMAQQWGELPPLTFTPPKPVVRHGGINLETL